MTGMPFAWLGPNVRCAAGTVAGHGAATHRTSGQVRTPAPAGSDCAPGPSAAGASPVSTSTAAPLN